MLQLRCRDATDSAMSDDQREVYFEFKAVGQVVRVAAIDAQTGIEVTVMGPATASERDLERLALQKLKARLAKG